jgi:hypothetical protein
MTTKEIQAQITEAIELNALNTQAWGELQSQGDNMEYDQEVQDAIKSAFRENLKNIFT